MTAPQESESDVLRAAEDNGAWCSNVHRVSVLTHGCRVGSSGCGLHIVPLIFRIALSLLRRHFVDFSVGNLRCDPNFPSFRTRDCFLAFTYSHVPPCGAVRVAGVGSQVSRGVGALKGPVQLLLMMSLRSSTLGGLGFSSPLLTGSALVSRQM